MSEKSPIYQVFARKYRPRTLADIKGQPTLVRILTNALRSERLGHAFIFHGIRGTGKTTTARVLARCLNCNHSDKPTVEPCGTCENCKAIESDRHIDVIEMDAASRTGVDDIREIIESSRFKPVLGRYKIFIIDEVHMLSKSAFNALLKTLEEPPEHVKFIFATTELNKVPATVLSRCMRFDLQRFKEEDLVSLFTDVCTQENITTDALALQTIAQAAEGSARDGLSILDQIANTTNHSFSADDVQHMLGISSHQHIADLCFHLIKGEIRPALEKLDMHYQKGVNLLNLFRQLMEFTHILTSAKAAGEKYVTYWVAEKKLQESVISILPGVTIDGLNRFWDILRTSYDDISRSVLPHAAARMGLIRLCFVADLPTPREILTQDDMPQNVPENAHTHTTPVAPAGVDVSNERIPETSLPPEIRTEHAVSPFMGEGDALFVTICAAVANAREPLLHSHLVHHVRCLSAKPGNLHLAVDDVAPRDLGKRLSVLLNSLSTNEAITWNIAIEPLSEKHHAIPTKAEQNEAEHTQKLQTATKNPLVMQTLEAFPGATVVDIKTATH